MSEDRTTLDQYRSMFHASCSALGLINERLGLDPDDGDPEPILDVIDELRAEIARLSAALAEKSAQLEEERARNAAMVPVAWMIQVASRTEFTTNEAKANLANNMRYVVTPLAIIPGAKP